MKKILFVLGTRPELIKLAPLIRKFRDSKTFHTRLCLTGQHREMLEGMLSFFELEADIELDLMRQNQSLGELTADSISAVSSVYKDEKPDAVIVQGDTTTAFVSALAAYYLKTEVYHVEAGLRSGNKYSPFPEEINRKLIGSLATMHFCPTQSAADALKAEQINESVFVTGNTVVDALLWSVAKIEGQKAPKVLEEIDFKKKTVLITGHRRESFGEPFQNICIAIAKLAKDFPGTNWIYPVHLNPNVRNPVMEMLSDIPNIYLLPPLNYPDLLFVLKNCYFVLTDSGGIQEEAPSLNKPVLVMRDVTERMEGVEAGVALLLGTEIDKIYSTSSELLLNEEVYASLQKNFNPYGKGNAAEIIYDLVKERLL